MKRAVSKSAQQTAPSLLKVLLVDLFVTYWLIAILAVAFSFSAIMLIYKSHDSRRLTTKWQSLTQQQHQQQLKSDALRLELTSLSESDRIFTLAKKKLGMIEVNANNEEVISL